MPGRKKVGGNKGEGNRNPDERLLKKKFIKKCRRPENGT
jgi:hypothetical protein